MIKNDIFYSMSIESIKGFDRIRDLSRALMILPGPEVMDQYKEKISLTNYLRDREEVYCPPNEKIMLQREFDGHIKTRVRDGNLISNATRSNREKTRLVVTPGMIYWNVLLSDSRILPLKKEVDNFFGCDCECVGDFLYPPQGYRSWHTNRFDKQGWVMFIVNLDADSRSFFKYKHPHTGRVVTVEEEKSSINFFRIDDDALLWHCIACDQGYRWSQGFIVPECWEEIIDLKIADSEN